MITILVYWKFDQFMYAIHLITNPDTTIYTFY